MCHGLPASRETLSNSSAHSIVTAAREASTHRGKPRRERNATPLKLLYTGDSFVLSDVTTVGS